MAKPRGSKMGSVILIDTEKCSGCRLCEVACSLKNMKECNPERSRIRVIRTQNTGQLEFVPSTCMQCETAMCELVCPAGAISRDPETGARIISASKCIGCSACSYACPFGAIYVDRKLGPGERLQSMRGRSTLRQGVPFRGIAICPPRSGQHHPETKRGTAHRCCS